MHVIKMRESMTNAFWACVPFNFLLIRMDDAPLLLLLLAFAVAAIYAAYAYKFTLAIHLEPLRRLLVVVATLLPIVSLVVLLLRCLRIEKIESVPLKTNMTEQSLLRLPHCCPFGMHRAIKPLDIDGIG